VREIRAENKTFRRWLEEKPTHTKANGRFSWQDEYEPQLTP